jgi:galactokinase/galactose-1-phosphate uridylyltransferase (family 1)
VSELRWHPFLEQWVITATHRQDRTFLPPEDYCPLCPTRPGGFPTEVPNDDYDLVVFENRFPSLQAEPPAPAVSGTALTPVEPARGICEVVLYSPRHHETLASMPLARIRNLAQVWRDRYLDLSRKEFVRYVFVFENRGEAVGVTLSHPHGQIYAFPFVPPVLEKELSAARAFHARSGGCLLCSSLAEERADGGRIVLEGERFVAFVPFFARYPYEVYLAPKQHQATMAEWTTADTADLAVVLKGLVTKFDALFGKPFPYVMVVHQAPVGGADDALYHLHFEFYPPLRSADRLKYLAGSESGAGTFIDDKLAEESAAELRSVGPASVAEVIEADRRAAAARPPPAPTAGRASQASIGEVLVRTFGPGGQIVTASAPGRVNLIGEHTDYNDGYVFPMAIGLGIEMAARQRPGREIRVHAADLAETVTFTVGEPIGRDPHHPWSNYLRGVLWALQQAGVELGGMDLAFSGSLPQGAGLSSSAALEVAAMLSTQALAGFPMERPRMAQLCQKAENEFVGMKCGIMDQFISLMGRAGHALLLDCRSLAAEQVPLELGDHLIAICHSGVTHALVSSEYNVRRQQCAAGVEALRGRFPGVRALRDATLEQLESCRPDVEPVVYRRCRHVIGENGRVLASAAALRAGDLRRFGRLMDASHDSLRDDFQVSCREIDLLVDLARQVPGVLGARITGGGFGGCTVNLVARAAVPVFEEKVLREYQRRTGVPPRLLVSTAAAGATVSSSA